MLQHALRPRHDQAYSPIGPRASSSSEPPPLAGVSGETFPVDSATKRDPRNRSATSAGTTVLVTQVVAGRARVPNFWPARKMTLGVSGSEASDAQSVRSARTTSTPVSVGWSARGPLLKRETARTRRGPPAWSAARRTMRATEGPIFPPAPRTATSPGQSSSAWITPTVGRERSSSSSDSLRGAWLPRSPVTVRESRGRCHRLPDPAPPVPAKRPTHLTLTSRRTRCGGVSHHRMASSTNLRSDTRRSCGPARVPEGSLQRQQP
jgi:hypothetical protein